MPTLKSITIDGQKFDLPESGEAPYSNVVELSSSGNLNLSQYTNSYIKITPTANVVITNFPTNSIIDFYGENVYTLTLPLYTYVPVFNYDENNLPFLNEFSDSFYGVRLVVSIPFPGSSVAHGSVYGFTIV